MNGSSRAEKNISRRSSSFIEEPDSASCPHQCQREFPSAPACDSVGLLASQTFYDTYFYHFLQRCRRSGGKCQIRIVRSRSSTQSQTRALTLLCLIPVLYFVWFGYEQSRWITHRRPWMTSKLNEAPPDELGCF